MCGAPHPEQPRGCFFGTLRAPYDMINSGSGKRSFCELFAGYRERAEIS